MLPIQGTLVKKNQNYMYFQVAVHCHPALSRFITLCAYIMFAILNIRTTMRERRVDNVKQANHIYYNNFTAALITLLRSISRVSKNEKSIHWDL